MNNIIIALEEQSRTDLVFEGKLGLQVYDYAIIFILVNTHY